jgi:hypothetical protein
VRHHQETKYAAKDQAAYEQQMYDQEQAQPQPQPQVAYAQAPAPAPAGGDDLAAQIQNLADLKAQGILSDDEFAAAKAKLISG